MFVEEDESAGAFAATGEELNSGLRGARGSGAGRAQKIAGGFGEDHFHDGFAIAGGGNAAGFGIGVAAAADERRIADAAGKFAAGAAGGGGGEQPALVIESDSADGSLFVATMMFGGVGIFAAASQASRSAGEMSSSGSQRANAVIEGKLFGALRR